MKRLLLLALLWSATAEAGLLVQRFDPRFDELVPADARLEPVATRHQWVEGPVWDVAGGALLFSDIPANSIFRLSAAGVALEMAQSGYSGSAPFQGREPGSNGLLFDAEGRLIICQHGDRRIVRREDNGGLTVLADRFEGRRLNSPNDAALHPSGDLYFTDPPFGLPGGFDDPARELPFSGVYRRTSDGRLELLIDDLKAPNGIAFSPDFRTLYVTDVDPDRPAWLAYTLDGKGRPVDGRVFHDARPWVAQRRGGPDGLKTDRNGNVFAAGPEAIFVFAADGTLLGLIETGVPTANVAWGEDGESLFIAADTTIYRIHLLTSGPDWSAVSGARSQPAALETFP